MEKRSYSLDFLKFVSCLGLLWMRFRIYTCPDGVYFGSVLINEKELGIDLRFFVEVFFVLSGYFMFSYIDKLKGDLSIEPFMMKRIIRIIPMLCLSTVVLEIMFLWTTRLGNLHEIELYQPALFGIVSASFGVEYGWGLVNARINDESWYLDILLLCYLIFFVMVKLSKRTKINEKYYFLFMILLGCACVGQELSLPFLESYNGRGYVAFFVGVILAMYLSRQGVKLRMVIASFICLLIYGIYHIAGPHYLELGKSYLMAFFVVPSLIIILKTNIAEKIFSWKGWGELGKISFSMYLIHVIVILAIFNITDSCGIKIDYAHEIVLFSYMIIVLLLGAIIYYCIEKPLTTWLMKCIEKNKRKAA